MTTKKNEVAQEATQEQPKVLTFKERIWLAISELNVPKGRYNEFGKYKYRSLDDIQEAFKVVGKKYRLWLRFTDDILQIGQRFYVKTLASIVDIDSNEEYSAEAMAREDEAKKGMDGSMLTGSASSFARKYAANALLCLNDVKDSDEVSGVVISSDAERLEYDSYVQQINDIKTVGALRSWWIKNERSIPYALHEELLNYCTERSQVLMNQE